MQEQSEGKAAIQIIQTVVKEFHVSEWLMRHERGLANRQKSLSETEARTPRRTDGLDSGS